MRVLIPSIVDPTFPGGAGTYLKGLIAALERQPVPAEQPVPSQIEWIVPFSRLARFNRIRQSGSLLRSLGSKLPSKALFQYSRAYRRAVREAISRHRPDVVAIFGADLLWLLDEIPEGTPTLLVALNREHALFRRQVDALRLPRFLRGLLAGDCKKLEDFEVSGIRRVHHVIFVSEHDADQMQEDAGPLHSLVVPPLFSSPLPDRTLRPANGPPTIGLMANLWWWRNQVGLRWLLNEVLPRVSADFRLHLYGLGTESLQHADPRLVGHGFIEDPEEVWRDCDFMICPGVRATGVNVKLAEAIYNSVPVLATSFGASGLSVEAAEGIVLADDTEDWIEFLNGPDCRSLGTQRISRAIGDRFAVDTHASAVQRFFASVAGGR